MAIYKDNNKTKDGRQWYFKIYKKDCEGNNKAYKSKKYLSKKEAQEAEALFILKRDNPSHKEFDLVWMDYITNLKKVRKDSTIYSYKKDYNNHIKDFFTKRDISSITVQNIREWAEKMEKTGISVAYMNKIHNILNKIFDFAIKNYNLPSNPSRIFGTFEKKNDTVVTDEEKLRYITYNQFQQFISVIDIPLWKAFFIFAYYTGCRRGEIIALKWKDIDFIKGEISINKTLYEEVKGEVTVTPTKNNRNRKIKMSKTLQDEMINYKQTIIKHTDFNDDWYVFGNTRFLPKTTITRYKNKYFQKANLEKEEITMHEFRHSHVSLLINEYIKSGQTDTAKFFLMMSNRMGHTIQVMQDTYMHLFPTIQDEIVNLLDNL